MASHYPSTTSSIGEDGKISPGGLQDSPASIILPLEEDNTVTKLVGIASIMEKETDTEEAALVSRAQTGDFDAFEELVKRTEARLYAHLLRLTENTADARELLQESYLSAYKNLGSFKGESSFSTWVYRIATNHALMHFRKKKPETSFEELPIPSHEELKKRTINDWDLDPGEMAHKNEVKRLLDEAIMKLPPPYRAVVALRDIEGLSTEETALSLGINPGAVKTRLHRARIFLRELLSPYFESEHAGSAKGGAT